MKGKTVVAVAFVVAVVVIPTVWSAGQATKSIPQVKYAYKQRDTLRGLEGVQVIVERPIPGAEGDGLTKQALQTAVELQLRQQGIKVLSQEESLLTPGWPYLNVSVTLVGIDKPIVAATISVQLKQGVFLRRAPSVTCTAATWDRAGTVIVGRYNLRTLRDDINDLVAMFINDYLTANPKDDKTKEEG